MDNAFKNLDYSDIISNYKNIIKEDKFKEIKIGKGTGILKLSLVIFIIISTIVLLILIINKYLNTIVIISNIEKTKQEINSKQLELNMNINQLEGIQYQNLELQNKIELILNQTYTIKKNIQIIEQNSKDINNDINILGQDIEKLKNNYKPYEDIENNLLLKELEDLEEQIERIKQSPL